jgi:NADH-quinone oxidoreductase subunit E
MLAPRKNETPVQYWISFWPTAPLFGVKWRFEGVTPAASFFNPVEVMARVAKAGADEAAKAAEAQSRAAAETLEEAVETTLDAAESVIDAAAGATQMMADESGAFVDELDAPTDDDAGEAPGNLYAARPESVDDLKQIKGVGPKLEAMLNNMGIWRFEQIAAFTPENLAWVDSQLTAFRGRPLRDDWIAQAKALL